MIFVQEIDHQSEADFPSLEKWEWVKSSSPLVILVAQLWKKHLRVEVFESRNHPVQAVGTVQHKPGNLEDSGVKILKDWFGIEKG